LPHIFGFWLVPPWDKLGQASKSKAVDNKAFSVLSHLSHCPTKFSTSAEETSQFSKTHHRHILSLVAYFVHHFIYATDEEREF